MRLVVPQPSAVVAAILFGYDGGQQVIMNLLTSRKAWVRRFRFLTVASAHRDPRNPVLDRSEDQLLVLHAVRGSEHSEWNIWIYFL